jgi:hypothetical protein
MTCASVRINLTNDPNDVWICSSDGQVGQICILNTSPELVVSSCNTISNSKIMCMQCVPPYRFKHSMVFEDKIQLLDIGSGSGLDESLIDYYSSDDDDGGGSQCGSSEDQKIQDFQLTKHSLQSQLSNNTTTSQDFKLSTMWIGNADGSLFIYQFNDATIRTVARNKNRISKQLPAGIQTLAYLDNKVFVSLKNGDLAVFKRNNSNLSWFI